MALSMHHRAMSVQWVSAMLPPLIPQPAQVRPRGNDLRHVEGHRHSVRRVEMAFRFDVAGSRSVTEGIDPRHQSLRQPDGK